MCTTKSLNKKLTSGCFTECLTIRVTLTSQALITSRHAVAVMHRGLKQIILQLRSHKFVNPVSSF